MDYRFLEAAKAGDLDTVQVRWTHAGLVGPYSLKHEHRFQP